MLEQRARNSNFQALANIVGTPGRNRTCDTQLRRLVLYPLSYERLAMGRLINLPCQVKTRALDIGVPFAGTCKGRLGFADNIQGAGYADYIIGPAGFDGVLYGLAHIGDDLHIRA